MFRLLRFWLRKHQQQPTLYLIRGIAGTGKTELAYALTPWNVAADDCPGLYDQHGNYNSDLQAYSHRWCKEQVEKWMEQS